MHFISEEVWFISDEQDEVSIKKYGRKSKPLSKEDFEDLNITDIEINKVVKGKPPIKPKKQVRGDFIHFLFSLFIGQNVTKFLSANV